jgi:hypothetical protein
MQLPCLRLRLPILVKGLTANQEGFGVASVLLFDLMEAVGAPRDGEHWPG